MSDIQELLKQLIELPQRRYSDLIKKVDSERRQAVEREEKDHPPKSGMSREEFARWIARRHFAIDKGFSRILYLPFDAPPKEVRLLEVNDLAHIPERAPVEAVDFMPEISGIEYSLFVADVSPRQFEAIGRGEIELPEGWSLKDAQDLGRSER